MAPLPQVPERGCMRDSLPLRPGLRRGETLDYLSDIDFERVRYGCKPIPSARRAVDCGSQRLPVCAGPLLVSLSTPGRYRAEQLSNGFASVRSHRDQGLASPIWPTVRSRAGDLVSRNINKRAV